MSNANNRCASCGAVLEAKLAACPQCGFKFPAPMLFADKASFDAWREQAHSHLIQHNLTKAEQFRRNKLMLFPTCLCVRRADENSTVIYNGIDAPQRLDGVVECSINTRHSVYLKSDRTVYAQGSNADGQCDLKDLVGIRGIYAGANCTYAIDSKGNVIVRGYSPVAKTVSAWRNIQKITGNKGRVVGLTEQGTLVIADDVQTISTDAKNVVDVDTTYNFTIWLHKNGTVGCLGKTNDPRCAASKWKNIIAVGVENYYAIGLKKDGSVVMAGSSVPGIDMDRSMASEWTDTVAIACSNSGILGVMANGTVSIVGNVENRAAICKAFEQDLATHP